MSMLVHAGGWSKMVKILSTWFVNDPLSESICLQQGFDLSKDVLWVSVGQRATEVQVVKFEG